VARAKTWFNTETFNRVENHQTRDEGRELRVACVFQLIGIGVEQQTSDISARNIRCFFDEFPRFVLGPRAPHAGTLRSLTGKSKCQHD
jgi:hypothetical protein